MARNERTRRSVHPWAVVVVILAALLAVFGPVLYRSVFGVRSITVTGNSYVSTDEVITSSGIRYGQSIFGVKADQVRDGVNANRYLEFVSVTRHYPSTVLITVTEHTPRVKMMWMGMLLIIGENGVVLERTSDIDIPVHVPEIIGMSVESVSVGEPIVFKVSGQGEAIENILDAIELQGMVGEVTEINISSPDSLSLMMESGLQVLLGDESHIQQKIALMRDTIPRLAALQSMNGGTLNVSSGVAADYQPPPQSRE